MLLRSFGANAWVVIAVVFVRAEEYKSAILLSGNIVFTGLVKWSAAKNGRLCSATNFAKYISPFTTWSCIIVSDEDFVKDSWQLSKQLLVLSSLTVLINFMLSPSRYANITITKGAECVCRSFPTRLHMKARPLSFVLTEWLSPFGRRSIYQWSWRFPRQAWTRLGRAGSPWHSCQLAFQPTTWRVVRNATWKDPGII